jgi:hypothetical protein
VKAGAKIEARSSQWQIFVLAYAVLLYDVFKKDTSEVFNLVLALGANPNGSPGHVDVFHRCTQVLSHLHHESPGVVRSRDSQQYRIQPQLLPALVCKDA